MSRTQGKSIAYRHLTLLTFHFTLPGAPDAQLNPKQKRWELVQPNLSTNASRQAIFLDPNEGGKEKLFKTDKGPLTVATLVGAKLR